MVKRLLREPLRFDQNDLLQPPPVVPYRTPTHRKTALKRAQALHKSLVRQRDRAIRKNEQGSALKVKEVTVSVEYLANLILRSITANGDVVDATGLAWPWEMISPDRIDPQKGYVEDSLRW